MSKKRQPIIEYSVNATLTQISKIPDARYRSGYRDYKTLGCYTVELKPETGAHLSVNTVHKTNNRLENIAAAVPVKVGKLERLERVL